METPLVNWSDLPEGPLWLVPPNLAEWQTEAMRVMRARAPRDPDVVWVLSSGTSSVNQLKCLGLTRAAILASAAAVNAHLRSTARDRWLVAIPTYHVGGFAIAARAHLSGAAVDQLPRWGAVEFHRACLDLGVTLTSLVPTQIFDLVTAKLSAPAALRAIVVGGGALDPELYRAARNLGWPVLPSYGLTETASQIATAALESTAEIFPDLVILPHAEIAVREDRLAVRGPSLASMRLVVNRDGTFVCDDPRVDGWLVTEDVGELSGQTLRISGRRDEVVKILGTLVAIPQVEFELRGVLGNVENLVVLAVPDPRRGHDLIAVTDQTSSLGALSAALDEYNAWTAGPRRVGRLCWVRRIPRTALGKVRRAALTDALGLNDRGSTAFI